MLSFEDAMDKLGSFSYSHNIQISNTTAVAGVVSIATAITLYKVYSKPKSPTPPGCKSIKDLPHHPTRFLLGNLYQVGLKDILSTLENYAWKYGTAYNYFFGPWPIVILSSPAAVDQFFKERPHNIRRSFNTEKVFEDSNIAGLFSMEGEQWRHSRNWMAPQLTHAKVNKASRVITNHLLALKTGMEQRSKQNEDIHHKWYPGTDHLKDNSDPWPETVRYDPKDLVHEITAYRHYAFSVIVDFAFAHDNSSLFSPTLFEDMKVIFEVVRRRAAVPVSYWKYGIRTELDRKFDKVITDLKGSIKHIIDNYNPEDFKDNSDKMSTMLESLWFAAQEDDVIAERSGINTARKAAKRVSIDDVIGNLITAIIAGFDTTSNTLHIITYFLSCHPEVQEKLQEEADRILGSPEKRANYTADELHDLFEDDIVKQFPYTWAVIQESNRLMPVASLIDGKLTKDLVIDNVFLPKGTTVFAMSRVASFRACPTPEPFKFKPERWIESTPEQRRLHEKLSWGFGGGPRVCPGRHLAGMELVGALAAVISLFDIQPMEEPFSAPKVIEGMDLTSLLQNANLRYLPRYQVQQE
ncbi:hypothetical protein NQZ79_g8217 [Umbelopsis isabellina]|nr:hypothetical protein NQZ79_g8217 [Umbelopsis isabellina]